MDYRTSLQHLLHKLLPSRAHEEPLARAPDFADTCPDDSHAPPATALQPVASPQRPSAPRSQSTIDLVLGTEVMEFPDDTAANLMDEFFAKAEKRAA